MCTLLRMDGLLGACMPGRGTRRFQTLRQFFDRGPRRRSVELTNVLTRSNKQTHPSADLRSDPAEICTSPSKHSQRGDTTDDLRAACCSQFGKRTELPRLRFTKGNSSIKERWLACAKTQKSYRRCPREGSAESRPGL